MPNFYKASFNCSSEISPVVGVLSDEANIKRFVGKPLVLINTYGHNIPGVRGVILTKELSFVRDDVVACCVDENFPFSVGDIVRLDIKRKRVIRLYHNGSNSNAIFLTERCNSNCLMCPQPPQNDKETALVEHLEFIKCLPNDIEELGITGGEPTLCRSEFLKVLQALKQFNCHIHVLSNARLLNDLHYVKEIAEIGLTNLTFGIPLYAATPTLHDYIVQSEGAFDQTFKGIYNLTMYGIPVEIRTVINKQTYLHLEDLADFIYFNLPFTYHCAYMGMEHMCYVKKNWEKLSINPLDYQDHLFKAIRHLHLRGMNTSIYNLPLCLLDKRLWPFARKSISDYKEAFSAICDSCSVKENCSGLFQSQVSCMPIHALSIVQ